MLEEEKKTYKLFYYWLFTSLIFVFFIIIVGGLTRLTNSGLSITEWELIKGIIPPLNKDTWTLYFNQYKKIPQYDLLNFNMTIDEFKFIFYWEYFHRIFARIIGLFFLIPLIYFYLTKKIQKKHLKICYIIFVLIFAQGIFGWYMVKSGLIEDVTVSHYRLSLHLSTALLIISTIFWLLMNINYKTNKSFFLIKDKNLPFQFFIFLIFVQIIMGAFVSGLDAGKVYQTWPLMGNAYFPSDLIFENTKDILDFDNHSLVQFYHRNLAYLIIFYTLILSLFIFKKKIYELYKPLFVVILLLSLQVILGIYTLISGLNIYLASAHQITSVLLVFGALNLYYLRAK
jgi:cytochrome c oxidase assembly protein subunit 15